MSDKPTHKSLVLVLGAGASYEAGFPLGSELKTQIAEGLYFKHEHGSRDHRSGDDYLYEGLRRLSLPHNPQGAEFNALLKCARHIHDAMPLAISIDNFIDSHREESRIASCGKLAIARRILAAERASILYVDRMQAGALDFDAADKTWLNAFFRLLTENCQKKDIEARLKTVSIITFNYDRSVEHFLNHALQSYYRDSSGWAAGVLKSLDIYHPYGRVGPLSWMGGNEPTDFGDEPSPAALVELSKQLLTFSEGTSADESSIEQIRRDLLGASRIAFLGFAFHPLNMELLFGKRTAKIKYNAKKVLGTAVNISRSDAELVSGDISSRAGIDQQRVVLQDLKCIRFFHEYQRSLSLV
jgi:hypothetical protein